MDKPCAVCDNALNRTKALKKGKAFRVIFEIEGKEHDEVIHEGCLAMYQRIAPECIKEIVKA